MPEEVNLNDIVQGPSLIISERPYGDVALAYTGGEITIGKAFELLAMAQQNLITQKFITIREKMAEAEKEKPDLVIARPKVKIRDK